MHPIPNVDNFPNFNNLVFRYLPQPALLINGFKVNSNIVPVKQCEYRS